MTDERFKQDILGPLNEVYMILKKHKDNSKDEDWDEWMKDIQKVLDKKLPYEYNEALYRVLLSCGDIIGEINRGET